MTIRIQVADGRIDIAPLFSHDKETKGPLFDLHASEILRLYDDSSFTDNAAYLRTLGVGKKNNPYPIQVSLLRYVIHRITTMYDRDPTRLLKSNTGRTITGSEHNRMIEVIDRAQLNLAMGMVDKMRALVRQAFVRYYPIDSEKAVVTRVFTPDIVRRVPSRAAPDRVEEDVAIALKIGDEQWECWYRDPSNSSGERQWSMVWCDSHGTLLEEQPFADTNFISPYGATLPISLIYDSYSGGRPWLKPRVSRLSWAHAVNLMGNELVELITEQAHSDKVYKTRSEDAPIPTKAGPGKIHQINIDDDLENLDQNPKIAECVDSSNFLVRMYLLSEDLNPNELGENHTPSTGAGLRVQERGLIARREAQIKLAARDERLAWEKIVALHNHHATSWGAEPLNPERTMHVEIGDLDIPISPTDSLNSESRKMALGISSVIDAIMELENLSREQAIARYERVAEDNETYPPASSPMKDAQDEGEPAITDNVAEINGTKKAESVQDLIAGKSAGDRREKRRD